MVDRISEKRDYEINKLQDKKDFIKNLDINTLNSYKTTISEGTVDLSINGTSLKNRYDKLLAGKLNDENLKNKIIQHSRLMIKNRITMHVIARDTRKTKGGIFKIVGIVPEDENIVKEYWMNKTVGSNDWNVYLNEFKDYLSSVNKSALSVYSEMSPMDRITINELIITTSFV